MKVRGVYHIRENIPPFNHFGFIFRLSSPIVAQLFLQVLSIPRLCAVYGCFCRQRYCNTVVFYFAVAPYLVCAGVRDYVYGLVRTAHGLAGIDQYTAVGYGVYRGIFADFAVCDGFLLFDYAVFL
jgi:hypothetical protein